MKTVEMKKLSLAEKSAQVTFLRRIIHFVELVTYERGEPLLRKFDTGHVHTIRELQNFADFSFRADIGQTITGGNTVKVWYHPGRLYKKKLKPVLDVWWKMDIYDHRLDCFAADKEWQKKIRRVIQSKKRISAEIDAAIEVSKMELLAVRKKKMLERRSKRAAKLLFALDSLRV